MAINTQTAPYFPSDRNGAYMAISALPGGASVDSIFFFNNPNYPITDTTNPYLQKILTGIVDSDSIGLYSTNSGATNATRLNAALASSKVKEIIFNSTTNTTIPITGTITCSGKIIAFRNNCSITGTNTLDSPVLDCRLTDKCFTINTTLVNAKCTRAEFSCENYGALGDGSDETAIVQKTADTVIANSKMPRVIKFLNNKTYSVQALILYNWNGTKYTQFTIALRGEVNSMGGNPTFTSTINILNVNGPGIGVQRATGFEISGLNLIGQGNIPGISTYAEFYSRSYATFASAGGVRDSPQSPHCLINIDPFRNTNTLPADGGYPDYKGVVTTLNPTGLNWYRGPGGFDTTGGSTAGVMRDLAMAGAAVGIGVGINGQTQQCENMLIERISANNLKTVTAWGQRESKGCHIKIGYSIDRVYNIMDGNTYGANQGTLPYVDGYTTSGSVVQFLSGSAQHPISFTNIYTETNFRIGDFNSNVGMAEFINCVFDFSTLETPLLLPQSHFTGTNVHFEGCVIRYYDDLFNKRAVFQGYGLSAHKTYFDIPPLCTSGVSYSGEQKMVTMDIKNCHYGDQGAMFGYQTLNGYFQTRVDYSIASSRITIENAAESFYGRMLQEYECGSFDRLSTVFAAATYTVNASARTAVLNAATGDMVPGQYILYFPPSSSVLQVLGRVSSVNYSTFVTNLVDVPITVPNGAGSISFVGISDYQKFYGRWSGTYTFNNATVTNVFGDPTVGGFDKFTGAVILAYNSGAKTVTLSRVALNTANVSPELYNPATAFGTEKITYTKYCLPTEAFVASDTTKYFQGDNWIVVPQYYGITANISGVRKFKCTQSGYLNPGAIGQTKQSLWVEVYDTDFKINASSATDFSTIIPKGTFISGWKLLATTAGMTVTTGTTNLGTDIDPGTTLVAGTSQIISYFYYADADTTIYFNGITSSGGTLSVNFF